MNNYSKQTVLVFLVLVCLGAILVSIQAFGLVVPPIANAIYLVAFVVAHVLFLFLYSIYLIYRLRRSYTSKESKLVILLPGLEKLMSRSSITQLRIRFVAVAVLTGVFLGVSIPIFVDFIKQVA